MKQWLSNVLHAPPFRKSILEWCCGDIAIQPISAIPRPTPDCLRSEVPTIYATSNDAQPFSACRDASVYAAFEAYMCLVPANLLPASREMNWRS